MASPMQGVIRHLRRAVLVQDGASLTDGQLLTLFIEGRDEGAFEALVRRHGPMVMGVCRRVLRNPHDAEDAFQATFLVLVRKAASVVPRDLVANWLYGVARTTALRANAAAAKRRLRETQVREMPEPEAVERDLWHDLQPLLDQELSRLPDKYRVAIVLCDLEGKSHKEAARRLGWPQGTLSARLSRGRKMLAHRLARHGLAVSGGVLAGALSQNAASACVPTSLVSSTVKAASLVAAGQAAVTGLISVKAAALTEGVVITMLLNKLKTVMTALMIAAVVSGAGLFYSTQAAGSAKDAPSTTGSQTEKETPLSDKDAEPGFSEPGSRTLLPSTPMPRQALVSLDKKGQLVVRTLDWWYQPRPVQIGGKVHTNYETTEALRTKHYDTNMVKVFDVRGQSINKKELPLLLKKETAALISPHVHAADPLNLRLFKEGTLLFVLPSPDPQALGFPEGMPPEAENVAVPPPPAIIGDTLNAPPPAPVTRYVPAAPLGAPGGAATFYAPIPPPGAVGRSPYDAGVAVAPSIIIAKADNDVREVHARAVKVPVMIQSEGRAALKHLYLLASADQGKTWEKVGTISPDEDSFVFRAPKDGLYWLTVQTNGRDGTLEPSELTGTLRPQLKILVNTGKSR